MILLEGISALCLELLNDEHFLNINTKLRCT